MNRWKSLSLLCLGILCGVDNIAVAVDVSNRTKSLTKTQSDQVQALEIKIQNQLVEGNFAKATRLAKETLTLREKLQGPRHWQVIDAKYTLERWQRLAASPKDKHKDVGKFMALMIEGQTLAARGQLEAAEKRYRQVIEDCTAVLGAEHPQTAMSYHNLAAFFNVHGKYVQALPLFAKALAINRKAVGENHPDTGFNYVGIAASLMGQAKYAQADPFFDKSLAIRKRTLGEDHPQTATTYHRAGVNLKSQRKFAKAQPYLNQSLAIRIRVLGDKHPETATSYFDVGSNFRERGMYVQAQPKLDKTLELRREILGEEHLTTLDAYNDVALNLKDLGHFARAELLAKKALEIYRKIKGEESAHAALWYNNLAAILNAQGRYSQGQPLHLKALSIRRKVFGERSVPVLLSSNNVGVTFLGMGKYAQAQAFFAGALTIGRQVIGEDNNYMAMLYANLATTLRGQGKYGQGLILSKKSKEIRLKLFGENHAQMVFSYSQLGAFYGIIDQYDKANEYYGKALEISRKIFGEKHISTADSFIDLSMILHDQRKYAQEQGLLEKALAIQRTVLGELHPHTAATYKNLAGALAAQGKHSKAQPYFEKAVATLRNIHGDEHPDTTKATTSLAVNLLELGKADQAVVQSRRALLGYEISRVDSNSTGFDRAIFTADFRSPRRVLAVALARLGKKVQAWEHAEADLARGLLDGLAKDGSDFDEQSRTRLARLQELDRLLVPLLISSNLSDTQRQKRDQMLKQRKELMADLAKIAAERSSRLLFSRQRIQNQIPADAAILLWLDAGPEHWGCVLRRLGEPQWEAIPGSDPHRAWNDADKQLPAKLHMALFSPDQVGAAALARLSQTFVKQRLAPLEKHLIAQGKLPAVRRLLVVSTGAVVGVPLEALTSKYMISYIPSGNVYARLAQKHRPLRATTLLALGDPVFQPQAERLAPPPKNGILIKLVLPNSAAARAGLRAGEVLLNCGDTVLHTPADLRKSLSSSNGKMTYWRNGKESLVRLQTGSLGLVIDNRPIADAVKSWRESEALTTTRGSLHPRLPGTRWEVEALSQIVGKNRTTLLLGSRASEQELDRLVREKKLGDFRILHFATHGHVFWLAPHLSALILAQDQLPTSAEKRQAAGAGQPIYNGELRVGTIIQNWQLDADLVVLSACKTGIGKPARGEGLLGFSHAFLQKGARAVVLSRWQVEDTATSLLMLRFYENMLGKRKGLKTAMGRAAALAEARDWLRNLTRKEVEKMAAALVGGVLRGSEVDKLPLVKDKPPKLPAGDKPFAHPFYWAAFVLIGDPD